jgi:serine/threonine protein kinase
MTPKTQTTFTVAGKAARIEARLDNGEGAQGEAYLARVEGESEPLVLKLFRGRTATDAARARSEALVRANLSRLCPQVLCAPRFSLPAALGVGHLSPLAAGRPLDRHLEAPTGTYVDHVVAALALAQGVAVLERAGVAHGDLQSNNVIIETRSGHLRARLIDFDNFAANDQPPPPCIGQLLYLAPEIRRAAGFGKVCKPDVESDRFALGVLMHELLLLRHPAQRVLDDADLFDAVMMSGLWLEDPAMPGRKPDGGLPSELLSIPLMRLFRRSLSLDRTARPSAAQWVEELKAALGRLHRCGKCGRIFMRDVDKKRCPHCRHAFPGIVLNLASGRSFAVDQQPIVLGHAETRSSRDTSRSQARLYRNGPEIMIEPLGASLARHHDGRWRRISRQTPVTPGMRIRIAEVEAKVAAL